ncbi:DUF2683 family protein [bacterium]|nr:DUF2683 family protein [bacterium]MBU1614318.1 DUF2683 family protein [bacterium]
MIRTVINITEEADQILDIIKSRCKLKDKSEAIDYIALEYGQDILEPELKPEFIEKMRLRQKEATVKIKDFRKHFELEDV